ncbi:MAG: maltooligosyltrehalose trehalohydrolase [Gammaproteobacteria bacterium]|jgi:1,4-alpha-glucan branching enzyme/maltooligosyltrehalose trehalohydrolase|nr:maltooligosyltrehalose trehalohydrolase [Gammaproteobacteria bacterium]
MPFGAEFTDDGRVRFRLWAPGARRVDLSLDDGKGVAQVLPMTRLDDSYYEIITEKARAGSLYRYRINGENEVPDPASRRNPEDVHGPSQVVDPTDFNWTDDGWHSGPWHEAVVYELHVGTFSPEGTFAGAQARLDHLVELGINVIELMPIADFPGKRGWGYDGVLQFAPESAYGTPNELKSFIAEAHKRGIAVMLDVVYNHFGPEGNYLGMYAPQFFTSRHHTPWGEAINFDGEHAGPVREFFINNTLYWLEEYHFDGLRFDAVHAIMDDSKKHIMTEIAESARAYAGGDRNIYLVLENGANQARFLGAPGRSSKYDAQWDDDVHHCLHTILTGEKDGYYSDYAEQPHAKLCRSLAEGFVYQGEHSDYEKKPRGEPSAHLPPTAFVIFLQNHDQIGNRALGERLGHIVKNEQALRAATAVLLLAPSPPMLFMGEEWNAPEPFPYFCDFEQELATKVREGRKKEFAHFERFRDPAHSDRLPDPTIASTMKSACLDWSKLTMPAHEDWLDLYRRLLMIRQRDIVPLVPQIRFGACSKLEAGAAFAVDWALSEGSVLHLIANLADEPARLVGRTAGRLIYATHPNIRQTVTKNELAPWSVTWLLERGTLGG